MPTFNRNKYSVRGVYDMIVRNGDAMRLDDIYREIEVSGELTEYDKNNNPTGATRYKHNVRGYLQHLKRYDMLENVDDGL